MLCQCTIFQKKSNSFYCGKKSILNLKLVEVRRIKPSSRNPCCLHPELCNPGQNQTLTKSQPGFVWRASPFVFFLKKMLALFFCRTGRTLTGPAHENWRPSADLTVARACKAKKCALDKYRTQDLQLNIRWYFHLSYRLNIFK